MSDVRSPFTSRPLLAAATLVAALAGSAGPGSAQTPTYRSVAHVAPGHVAWMHKHPDAASERVGYLKAGAIQVRTLGCRHHARGGWCQVVRRGTRGWVQDRYLSASTVMRG